jgi:NAD(P)-dependent dehydrogenase (short-subunit alcohol dehydrogenase family)
MISNVDRPRHALVTGGGSGIGAAIAQALVEAGLCVTVTGRRLDVLQSLTERYPGKMQAVVVDVTDAQAVTKGFAQAREAFGPVQVLVNNAGQAHSAPFLKTSADHWQTMLSVNLGGTLHCSQAALPDMLATGWGRIVNVASTAGLAGYAYVAAYCAAKHGVVGLTRSMALEFAKKGITVNAVCPGYTETEILQQSIANVVAKTGRTEAQARAEFATSNPQGRIVLPHEVADAVRWLCGDAAASITGQSIAICGGELMH